MPYVDPQTWLNLTLLGMVIGLITTLLPLVPGLVIIWGCALAYYALVTGWSGAALAVVIVMAILMVAGMSAEFWLAPAGAKRGGASCLSSILASLAGVVGFFIIPGLGAVLLPIIVVLVIEYWRARDAHHAGRAATAYFIAWLLSNGIELLAGVLMIAIFWWAAA